MTALTNFAKQIPSWLQSAGYGANTLGQSMANGALDQLRLSSEDAQTQDYSYNISQQMAKQKKQITSGVGTALTVIASILAMCA